MTFSRNFGGISTGFSWHFRDTSVTFLWNFGDISMEFSRHFRDVFTTFSWNFHLVSTCEHSVCLVGGCCPEQGPAWQALDGGIDSSTSSGGNKNDDFSFLL